MLAVRLPRGIEERLGSLAKRTGKTKSYYVRRAIVENLDDMEDVFLADKSKEEVLAGGEVFTHEEMMVRYGVDRSGRARKSPIQIRSSSSRTARPSSSACSSRS
jgi:RHH-type rel operon transcriptional repressor/antitoxin RelB